MSIAARLRLAAVVPAVMAIAFVVTLILSFVVLDPLRDDQATAIYLRTDLSDLDQIARSYLVRHDESSRQQYAIKDVQIMPRLSALESRSGVQKESVEYAREDVARMRILFDRMVENSDAAAHGEREEAVSVAEQRLATQFFIHSRDANRAAADMAVGIADEIIAAQRRVYILVTIFTVGAALLLTAGILGLVRSINNSLAMLMRGTEIVGRGQLDHRIALNTSDELGDLSDSFDRMAESLQAVTVSKALLEAEIEERQRAQEELHRSMETTRSLLDTATAMASWTDLDELLRGLADVVLETTAHSRVTVSLWDASASELSIAASAGKQPLQPKILRMKELSSGMRHAIDTGQPLLNDYGAASADERGTADLFGSQLSLLVPLRYRQRTVGVIGIDDPGERREFTQEEMQIIRGIAAQAAVSVENARLFEASLSQLARTTVLKEAAAAALALDPVVLSQNVLESFHRLLGIRRAVIYSVDRDEYVMRNLATYGYQAKLPAFGELHINDESISGRAVMTDTVATYRFDDLPEMTRQRVIESGETDSSWVAVPVHAHGQVIGCIILVFDGDRRYSSDDIGLFTGLADQFGIALENARLYQTERRIADRLQEALLSLPERIHGLDFAHVYHSATESARVGGDFYDMFEIANGRVGITIGDVAGKGLDAAVLTSLVKNTIRAHATDSGKSSAEVLLRTNEVVYKATPTESFVTVFYAQLDCGTGELSYASAGHTTSAILRRDGSVTRLPSTGTILGGFAEMELADVDVAAMRYRETLFLYTDGLTEARNEQGLYGEGRLFNLLSANSGASEPGALLRVVLDDVLAYSGENLHDDLALLAVQRLPREQDESASHRTEVSVVG